MFKKLKDKLAEEVKSSPQRIQQFAQAAQAAVTSASSSISDITNSDLFSIGDNDTQQQSQSVKTQATLNSQQNTFQDVSLVQPLQPSSESMDYPISSHDILDNQRQRRLSNSSFASDVSFRLPSYESPSMYHLQSDMEVSASEAEERGFSGGTVSLDRVTKEQLYAAYRRTQERYTKYRTQYGDLARHYKLLERENAKARSVLVETQDKALRRISELREQCSLEQSAKAHLEKALRVEIEERNMKIETLNTKISLLQNNSDINKNENVHKASEGDGDVQLINLSSDNDVKRVNDSEAINVKIDKMEQLLNKYKESLKVSKEKNSQINTELQILSNEVESKNKEIEDLNLTVSQLSEAKQKIQELSNLNEELQNKINVYEFNKTREQSTLELDYQKAQEEIAKLNSKIEIFSKREEEYAISLAENKLSIHKELESKEAEIRSLKDNLDISKKEIQSLNIVVSDYKKNLTLLEAERSKLLNDSTELASIKSRCTDLEVQIEELSKKCQILEQSKTQADEAYKCLQLQMKQETAEKLAMIDRNAYLENRNKQLSEENIKKSNQICTLGSDLEMKEKSIKELAVEDSKKYELLEELRVWKDKYSKLELEIQEERDELIKLQSEIETLLSNHELLQTQNIEFRKVVSDLKSENASLEERLVKTNILKMNCLKLANDVKDIKKLTKLISNDAKSLQIINNQAFISVVEQMNYTLKNALQSDSTLYTDMKRKNISVLQAMESLTSKHDDLLQQFHALQDENHNLKSTISEFELRKINIEEQIKNITNQYEIAIQDLNSVKGENEILIRKINDIENNFQNVQVAIEYERKQYTDTTEKLKLLETEKFGLLEKVESLEKENYLASKELDTLKDQYKSSIEESEINKDEQIKNIKNQYEIAIQGLNSAKGENNNLIHKIKDIENNYQNVQVAIELERKQNLETIEKLKLLETEKQKFMEIIESMKKENDLVSRELVALRDQYTSLMEESDVVKHNNANLLQEIKVKNEQIDCISTIQEENKNLSVENISLKSQTETIADSYKILETEINDVRKTYEELLSERDDLRKTIENLENSPTSNTLDQDSQTDNIEDSQITENIVNAQGQSTVNDNISGIVEKKLVHLQSQPLQLDDNEQSNKYLSLKSECEELKEENRRFRSDIEGLQTYLTKISKENSVLNDKLRELIATSEHSFDSNVVNDLLELKTEFQVSKEKNDDLLRENTLLIEENLELKDQLQIQNYPQPKISSSEEKETSLIKEKYNNLLQVNSTLEQRLADLEQMNKSFNGNITQMHEKNEKLRLSNEKLERRLDEALVSLRHLHSLQENTELEYLRNILYEYLTGSGSHSVTLAKVLSAVVKFDDMQTKLVLQKEKERQGFLRQLGII